MLNGVFSGPLDDRRGFGGLRLELIAAACAVLLAFADERDRGAVHGGVNRCGCRAYTGRCCRIMA